MTSKIAFSPDKRSWSPSPLVGQIVLVTTLNEDGQSNIAPKSWISMMVFEPPVLVIGCSRNHWTAQNILRTGEFVVNIPGAELAGHVWRMHTLPHPRPVEAAGLTPAPAQKVGPPMVQECRAHLECRLVQQVSFGDEIALFGEIAAGAVDRAVLESSDPYAALRMMVFLENDRFGVIESSQRPG